MDLVNTVIAWVLKKRMPEIEHFKLYPEETQKNVLLSLVDRARSTKWGRKYHYGSIRSERVFKERVPLSTYEDLFPYIERVLQGEEDVLWPTPIQWFSKSSGTTNARSKFIPVSYESLEECHYQGGKDMITLYFNSRPEGKVFTGKNISMGGSLSQNPFNPETQVGDVSAIIINNLPFWAHITRAPSLEIGLMSDWEPKIELMARETMNEDVTGLQGVPTWTVVLLKKILEITGKEHIHEVWPNLEVFNHGAVAFGPYKEVFKQLIPGDHMVYQELYNASEGFFAIEDVLGTGELLLLLDHGIYYEFIPLEEVDTEHPKTLSVGEVEIGKSYAMVISTNAGLWRYMIGDTVKFTSLRPHRIRITGRTKHFINAFGEELVIENAEIAVAKASEETGASVLNFTAAPIYMGDKTRGGHEWLIEFEKEPDHFDRFIDILDNTLREINSDYDAKRVHDIALGKPLVKMVPKGTFYTWLKSKGKVGGQNKVPRLANTREYIDEILALL